MMTLLNTGVQLICIFILASRGNKEHMHHYKCFSQFFFTLRHSVDKRTVKVHNECMSAKILGKCIISN